MKTFTFDNMLVVFEYLKNFRASNQIHVLIPSKNFELTFDVNGDIFTVSKTFTKFLYIFEENVDQTEAFLYTLNKEINKKD